MIIVDSSVPNQFECEMRIQLIVLCITDTGQLLKNIICSKRLGGLSILLFDLAGEEMSLSTNE